jgi:hypothetical protein
MSKRMVAATLGGASGRTSAGKVRNEGSWQEQAGFDDKGAEHPAIQERVSHQNIIDALADGMVTKQELAGQEQRLTAAMKKVET